VAQATHSPLTFVSGAGAFLTADDGYAYLDFSSQLMVTNLGHQHPHVLAGIRTQLEGLAFVQPAHLTPVREQLGERLSRLASGVGDGIGPLGKIFITTGGAEAIENAIKMARMVTGRHKILTRYRAYHGATTGALTLSGDSRRHAIAGAEMPGVIRVEDPYCYRCPWGQTFPSCDRLCISHIERVIEFEGPDSIAAIVMEGASGSSGCLTYPPEYWPALRRLADAHGIVLISDEVMSGFCRTGSWFAVHQTGVQPDMIVMAKGLTCGTVPMGAVWVSDGISRYFDDKPLQAGLTYGAHPLGCAAALACLETYESEKSNDRVQRLGPLLQQQLKDGLAENPCVGDIRGVGFLQCIELVKPGSRDPLFSRQMTAEERSQQKRLAAAFLAEGLLVFMRLHYVFVAPPLVISEAELVDGVGRLVRGLRVLFA
jgi:taurine--2-oxoglutarate transaminase